MARLLMVVVVVLLIVGSFSYGDYPSDRLVQALAVQESGDNDKVIGDRYLLDHAYGHLQIRRPCLDDVNRKFGTHHKASECLRNRDLSEWVCREYINMYATTKALGHKPTDRDKARIWNGGPPGFRSRSTLKYWASVKKILAEL